MNAAACGAELTKSLQRGIPQFRANTAITGNQPRDSGRRTSCASLSEVHLQYVETADMTVDDINYLALVDEHVV